MSRTGSAGRSFLDDLLAEDLDKPSSASAKRKSVRFMDNDDNSGDIFGTNLMSSLSSRESSAKDRQKSGDSMDISGNRATKASNKSDWLGLGDDQPNDRMDRPKTNTISDSREKQTTEQKDDWLNSGLNARQNRATNETKTTADIKDKTEDNSWLSIRKKAEESKVKTSEQIEETPPTRQTSPQKDMSENKRITDNMTNRSEPEMSPIKSIEKVADTQSMQTLSHTSDTNISVVSVNTSSVLLLQTQVKMLELEKTYLQQTLDQIKANHCEEMKIMTALHEQQMRMTTDMYKRHEDMVQEERDRRINDLKIQLTQSEKDMEDMRRRNNERVQYLENQWQTEVERLKEMHSSTTKKLSEQHEQDLARIRKIKEQEIESVNALQNHGLSLESLLNKWEKSAQQIEELHKSVITKQEEILKHKFNDIEIKNTRLVEVEVNWHSLINELEVERSRCSDETKKLYDIIEQQKQLLHSEQKRLIEERLQLETQKRQLNEDKQHFDIECNRMRDTLIKESDAMNETKLKLKDEFTDLETKKSEINLKDFESKQTISKERDEINRLYKEVEDKRNEIHRELSQIQHQRMAIQTEEHQFEQRKLMFDIEKQKMQELAQEIAKRAEELESLSEIALHEKREGHLAMDEADKFKKELDSKLKFIEESFDKLRSEEDRVSKMRHKVEQELEYIKETKDNIVCNLCGSGLNRAKMNGMTKNSLNDFNNISSLYSLPNQWTGITDNDRALLVWQISGQQDAALLEQETAFVNAIRSQTTHTTGIAFQQNDYFLN